MILISEIIARYEKMSWNRWPERPKGGKSIRIDDIEYQRNRREEIVADIRLLEAEGLVCMKRSDWVEPGRDPARVPYRLEDMDRFYALSEITPKWERLENQKAELQAVRDQVKTPWILNWLDDEGGRLAAGKPMKEEEILQARKLWVCMTGLNQQTLTQLTLCASQRIRLVRMIENKANFVAEPYEEGKLVIFTHGYITPGERIFLRRLREILDSQPDPVRYEHSGDLDFGGISIYRYLREQVFPELTPYRMDTATYEMCTAKGMAEEISEDMAEKLSHLAKDPQLGELAARLARDKQVVEQEAYLSL